MNALTATLLCRADEQVAAIGRLPKHDPDTWDVKPQPKPPRFVPTKCRYGGCTGEIASRGYCHKHWMRIRRGTLEAE